MGNQFNYELDDRQIKLTMLSATVPLEDVAWNNFKHVPTAETKHFTTITKNIPKFEMGVSRSIIVPVVFILVIGGLSAILFNVIDFKKSEKLNTEIPLDIPQVTEKSVSSNDVTIDKNTPVKKEIIVAKETKSVEATPKNSVITPTASIAINSVKTPSVTEKKVENKIPEKKSEQNVIADLKPNAVTTTTTSPVVKKKKKKQKETVEEIPVLIPQTTILSNEPSTEPEIELK